MLNTKAHLWYWYLGHINSNYLVQLTKHGPIIELLISKILPHICSTFLYRKQATTKFSKVAIFWTFYLLELIHFDPSGYIVISTFFGFEYFIIFIDNYIMLCLFHYKSEFFEAFKVFLSMSWNSHPKNDTKWLILFLPPLDLKTLWLIQMYIISKKAHLLLSSCFT